MRLLSRLLPVAALLLALGRPAQAAPVVFTFDNTSFESFSDCNAGTKNCGTATNSSVTGFFTFCKTNDTFGNACIKVFGCAASVKCPAVPLAVYKSCCVTNAANISACFTPKFEGSGFDYFNFAEECTTTGKFDQDLLQIVVADPLATCGTCVALDSCGVACFPSGFTCCDCASSATFKQITFDGIDEAKDPVFLTAGVTVPEISAQASTAPIAMLVGGVLLALSQRRRTSVG